MRILTPEKQYTEEKQATKPPPMRAVVLRCLGLMGHSSCTIDALREVFHMDKKEARRVLDETLLNGETVLGVFTPDVARTKVYRGNGCMCSLSPNEFRHKPSE